MKSVRLFVSMIVVMSVAACAALQGTVVPKGNMEPVKLNPAKTVTVIIPSESAVNADSYSTFNFPTISNIIMETRDGNIAKRSVVGISSKTEKTFRFEARIDNGVSGSGRTFDGEYSLSDKGSSKILKITPTSYKPYQEGLVFPFAVPNFSDEDLFEWITNHPVYFSVEIDSDYPPESIYANFERLAKREAFTPGSKDAVTGKIFKNRYSIKNRDSTVYFSVETFPYRNGSKAVLTAVTTPSKTGEYTYDLGVHIEESKAALLKIVKS